MTIVFNYLCLCFYLLQRIVRLDKDLMLKDLGILSTINTTSISLDISLFVLVKDCKVLGWILLFSKGSVKLGI